MTIKFSCVGQSLIRVDTDVIAANSLKFLTAHFDLDEVWKDLAVTACFTYKNTSIHIPVYYGECTVPWAVIKAGEFRVSLIGIEGDKDDPTIRATSTEVRVRVEAGPEIENVSNAEEPTLTVVEQLTAAVNRAVETAEDVRDDAAEGKFNGKDGKSAYQIAVDNGFEGNEEEWLESLGGVDENAVNEIIEKYLEDNEITGEVDPEEIKKIVEDYLAENSPEAGVDAAEVQKIIEDYLKANPPVVVETDPTVPAWAKAKTKPPYTADEVGAESEGSVSEHNNSTNAHSDLRREVASAKNSLSVHNNSENAHNDIRLRVAEYIAVVEALLNSDDETLNETKEIVEYIKSNRALIEAITTNKVNVADIVNNLTTNVANKPLSAAQGKVLKGLIDAISVPTKLSELSGDSTHRTVTDAEKSAWNGKSDFSGSYNDLTNKPTIPTVPTKLSSFTDDVGYLKKTQLPEAVNTALAQAKESGEFDGADGERGSKILKVTTASTSYTTTVGGFKPSYRWQLATVLSESGAKDVKVGDVVWRSYYHYPVGYVDSSYVYTDAYVSIRGAKGDTGATGAAGKDGADGKDGENYILTEADKDEIAEISMQNEKGNIVQQIITELQGLPVFGVVDEDKTITVTSQLTDGTYTLKYENADGTTTDIGTIIIGTGGGSGSEPVITGISAKYTGGNVTEGTAVTSLSGITVTATYSDGSTQTVTDYTLSEGTINAGSNTITVTYEGFTTTFTVTGVAPSYVNLVPTAKTPNDFSSLFNNGVGYMDDMYASSSSPFYKANNGTFVTGAIESEKDSVFYIKGVTIDPDAYYHRLALLGSGGNCYGSNLFSKMTAYALLETPEKLGKPYYKLTMNADYINANCATFKYIMISAAGSGANCIISKTPIE